MINDFDEVLKNVIISKKMFYTKHDKTELLLPKVRSCRDLHVNNYLVNSKDNKHSKYSLKRLFKYEEDDEGCMLTKPIVEVSAVVAEAAEDDETTDHNNARVAKLKKCLASGSSNMVKPLSMEESVIAIEENKESEELNIVGKRKISANIANYMMKMNYDNYKKENDDICDNINIKNIVPRSDSKTKEIDKTKFEEDDHDHNLIFKKPKILTSEEAFPMKFFKKFLLLEIFNKDYYSLFAL